MDTVDIVDIVDTVDIVDVEDAVGTLDTVHIVDTCNSHEEPRYGIPLVWEIIPPNMKPLV